MRLTFAFCTYNRADRLVELVQTMRCQVYPVPFEILAINNNSQDDTLNVLSRLTEAPGTRLRVVTETVQGIVAARNRAIEESLNSDILVFIDDDELPMPGLLKAACDAIIHEGADCVGGRVAVNFAPYSRPRWLRDELLGFLAEINYGKDPFWIDDGTTPIWTANIAYAVRLFREDAKLRFDSRYDRKGEAIGGGSDAIMFRVLLARGARIRYEPKMLVEHFVDSWRVRRSYFLRLHYVAGRKLGLNGEQAYTRMVAGVPPFLFVQAMRQICRTCGLAFRRRGLWLREAMNLAHTVGMIVGRRARFRRQS